MTSGNWVFPITDSSVKLTRHLLLLGSGNGFDSWLGVDERAVFSLKRTLTCCWGVEGGLCFHSNRKLFVAWT